jgi:hypothetical protein
MVSGGTFPLAPEPLKVDVSATTDMSARGSRGSISGFGRRRAVRPNRELGLGACVRMTAFPPVLQMTDGDVRPADVACRGCLSEIGRGKGRPRRKPVSVGGGAKGKTNSTRTMETGGLELTGE